MTDDRLTEAERDLIIDTGRHVYGCCNDQCPDHGLPEDAQIAAAESILSTRLPAARTEGAIAELEYLAAFIEASRDLFTVNPETLRARAAEFRRAGQQQKEGQ